VEVLERFAAGHAFGSSHGHARIFRLAYPEADYVELAQRALAGWRSLGRGLLTVTGGVDHGDPAVLAALEEQNVTFERLSVERAAERWPGLRFDRSVLFQADAGRIDAEAAVQAMLAGLTVRQNVRVDDVGELDADLVVLATGAWTPALAPAEIALPELTVTLEQPVHFPAPAAFDWPSFIHHIPAGRAQGIYGLAEPGAGVKVGEHGSGAAIDPESPERAVDPATVERLADYARRWLPGVDADRAVATPCLYDTTPTHDPVIDRVGDVILAYGFSGHGFKFAPAVGELVADLAEGAKPPERFALM
jgi:sarcosine oxidase